MGDRNIWLVLSDIGESLVLEKERLVILRFEILSFLTIIGIPSPSTMSLP
jgi:hypothetical protein